MEVYRLVNSQHDPIEVGKFLTRQSDHSRQKLGPGLYFLLDYESVKKFITTKHGHSYTHLLHCELIDIQECDFVDSRPGSDGRRAVMASKHWALQIYGDRFVRYCQENKLKGVIWTSRGGWSELCLYREFISGSVKIIDVEPPPETDEADGIGEED